MCVSLSESVYFPKECNYSVVMSMYKVRSGDTERGEGGTQGEEL